MKIETSVGTKYTQNPSVSSATLGASTTASSINTPLSSGTVAGAPVHGGSVTLSGRSIMLSRLFRTQDTDSPPSVASASADLTRTHLSQNPVDFLTKGDLSLVSDIYAYAKQNGADLTHVDTLAITLGTYRQFDNGKTLSGFNGSQFDSEGHQLSSSYSPSDTATANRILNGDAIKSTRLDPGFLNYILQPTHALSNMASVDFMEGIVNRFSDRGAETMSLDSKFSAFVTKDSAANSVVITASKEVVNNPPKSQIANINGRWFILDPSILSDPRALKATGLGTSQLADAKKNEGVVALALLDSDPKKSNGITTRLLDLLGTNKQPLVL